MYPGVSISRKIRSLRKKKKNRYRALQRENQRRKKEKRGDTDS